MGHWGLPRPVWEQLSSPGERRYEALWLLKLPKMGIFNLGLVLSDGIGTPAVYTYIKAELTQDKGTE